MEEGVYTVLVTPFNSDNQIDFESYDKLLNKILSSNIEGVVVLGTTSEGPTLNYNEKILLIKSVWKKFNGKKKIVIGIGGNDTLETLEFAKLIKDYCDYMMVTVPYYNKPSQEGIIKHFEIISQNEDLISKKMILYNIPSRCGVNMNPETISHVYNTCENIVAIKEASGSLNQVMDIKRRCNIQIFSGDDSLLLPTLSIGGCGVISVIGNILPNEIHNIYSLYRDGFIKESQQLFYKMYDLMKGMFIDTNPVPVKSLLNYIKIFNTAIPRLPLLKLSDDKMMQLINIYEKTQEHKYQEINLSF